MAQHPLRVALDLEMTGPTAGEDAIIEIGAVKFIGDAVVGEELQLLVATQHPIPYGVRRLTGIRDDQVRNGAPLGEALSQLAAYVGDAPIVGHNIAVDMRFLRASGLSLPNQLLDTYDLAVTVLPELKIYTLEALAAHLGVTATRFHRACDDAQTTRQIFLKLLARLQALDPHTRDRLARLPASEPWTISALLGAPPPGVSDPALPESNGFAGLDARLAAQQDINPGVFQLEGIGQPQSLLLNTPPKMPVVPGPASVSVRHAVAQLAQRLLSEGGAQLLDLDLDRADLVSLLAPAARWAVDTGGRVVISVPDAAMMSHIARAVTPEAFAAAGVSRSQVGVAELAEREAYLCMRRWFGGASVSDGVEMDRDVLRGLARLTVWSQSTERGSRGELALRTQEESAWTRSRGGVEVRDSAMNCPYDAAGYCFLTRAQNAANMARFVVTTHRALAAALLGQDNLLPRTTRVIALDPAALEDTLREAAISALRYDFVAALLNDLSSTSEDGRRAGLLSWAWRTLCPSDVARGQAWAGEVDKAQASAESFFAALHIFGQLIAPNPKDYLAPVDLEARREPAWREVSRAWNDFKGALDGVINLLRAIANESEAQSPRATSDVACAMVELLFAARQLEAVRDAGDELLTPTTPEFVTWIRRPGDSEERAATPRGRRISGGPVQCDTDLLGVAPVSGAAVRPLAVNGNGLLLAGPGLAAGGDFDYARGLFGLPYESHAANFGRDRSDQTLLCMPTDVPEPGIARYQERLNQTLIRLAMELDGRLVVYFASRSALRAGAQGIRQPLEQRGFLVLAQDIDGPSRNLWRRFNAERRAVLLGGSFWKATPEQTRGRYCVVVPRLPLPAESDPLVAARASRWTEPYEQYALPTAAQRMRIALSRLAWSHDERNAVVLFDGRAHSGDAGHAALATLPRCQELRAPVDELAREIADWIGPA